MLRLGTDSEKKKNCSHKISNNKQAKVSLTGNKTLEETKEK